MAITQLSAIELKIKLQSNDDLFLLDVREPHEFQYAHISNSMLIPLNQLPQRVAELHLDDEIVVICHHGMRSQQAANYLAHCGFSNVSNLVGGVDAWASTCDSSMPRY
jgi:rhodanese-related sulfurtransferase